MTIFTLDVLSTYIVKNKSYYQKLSVVIVFNFDNSFLQHPPHCYLHNHSCNCTTQPPPHLHNTTTTGRAQHNHPRTCSSRFVSRSRSAEYRSTYCRRFSVITVWCGCTANTVTAASAASW